VSRRRELWANRRERFRGAWHIIVRCAKRPDRRAGGREHPADQIFTRLTPAQIDRIAVTRNGHDGPPEGRHYRAL